MMNSPTIRLCHWISLVMALLLAGLPLHSRAGDTLYVVVSANSTVQSMTQKELLALYTGRVRTYSNGQVATPLDQKRDSPARESFYLHLAGMDIARINSYWARLHFTGQVQPPQALADDAAVMQKLRADPTAIGYLTRPPRDPALRELLRLPQQPEPDRRPD